MRKPIKLICKAIIYHSTYDEDAFFEWIKKIPVIIRIDGIYDELYLYVKSKNVSRKYLLEIISLFYRYKINMEQLQIFLNKKNELWIRGKPHGYWYKQMFKNNIKKMK